MKHLKTAKNRIIPVDQYKINISHSINETSTTIKGHKPLSETIQDCLIPYRYQTRPAQML